MNIPDMDWQVGWAEEVAKMRNADWSTDYERGFEDGILRILTKFEQELYVATKEDPQYAEYLKDSIKIIKHILNPMIKEQ